jgi:hypothetical protein
MWLRMRNAQQSAQGLAGSNRAGTLCHRLHAQHLLGEAAVGQHVLQKLLLLLPRNPPAAVVTSGLLLKMLNAGLLWHSVYLLY